MSTIGPNGEIENEGLCDGSSPKYDRRESMHEYNESRREYIKAYNYSHREDKRAFHLKKRYGLTTEDYQTLNLSQQGRCAICRKTPEEVKQTRLTLAVDHNHTTKVVRGLLCDRCNRNLGWYEKHETIVGAYLEKEY